MRADIQNELVGMEAFHLLALKQRNQEVYHVPEGYFTETQIELLRVSQIEESYKVPAGYFDNLTDSVLQNIDEIETPQPVIKKNRNRLFSISAVAASVAIVFAAIFGLNNQSTNQANSAAVIQETFDETELAFLYEDSHSYVFDALYEDFGTPEEEDFLLDPLFEDDMQLEELFEL